MAVRAMHYEAAYGEVLLSLGWPFTTCPRPHADSQFLSFFNFSTIHFSNDAADNEGVLNQNLLVVQATRLYPFTRLGYMMAEELAINDVKRRKRLDTTVYPIGNVVVKHIIMMPGVLERMAEEPELAGLVSDIQGNLPRDQEAQETLLLSEESVGLFSDKIWVPGSRSQQSTDAQ